MVEVTKWSLCESSPGDEPFESKRICASATVTPRNGGGSLAAGIEPFTYHGSSIASRPTPLYPTLSVTGDGCGNNMFRCNDGKCIQSILVCDYRGDCDDNSDEMQSCRKYERPSFVNSSPRLCLNSVCMCYGVRLDLIKRSFWSFWSIRDTRYIECVVHL